LYLHDRGFAGMIYFRRDGDWWDFDIGRLRISYWSKCAFERRDFIAKAPGYWYFNLGEYQVAWKRKYIVWGDHPFRGRNIRLYDQFGTFAKKDLPG